MKRKKRILVAPLDWGLGHATRCIPIIKTLLEVGAEPVIAAYGKSFELLLSEFPDLEVIRFEGFKVRYSRFFPLSVKMAAYIPYIALTSVKEHKKLTRLIAEYEIDGVISDQRFGLWTDKVPSVYISHQLNIKVPLWARPSEYLLYRIQKFVAEKYDFCWIPDRNGSEPFSGDLSHKRTYPVNAACIGPLSRFEDNGIHLQQKYDLFFIISGHEPQRTLFEKRILKEIKKTEGKKILVARGLPGAKEIKSENPHVDIRSHIPTEEFQEALLSSGIIISRGGYSTIMDLAIFGKKAVFVPTPGQTEQVYLAKLYEQRRWAPFYKNNDLDLCGALEKVKDYKGIPQSANGDSLKNSVKEFLEK